MKSLTWGITVQLWWYRGLQAARGLRWWMYSHIFLTKEERIQLWWRAQQLRKRDQWVRQGFSDAQKGIRHFPHHGSCRCALCEAYASGYRTGLNQLQFVRTQ